MKQSHKKRVLVVEDNHMNKVLVREILTINGYEIIEANTGAEALKLVSTEKPDVILMDLQLPVMDGYTATRLIRADERNRDIPILALTASAMKSDEEKILKSGFNGYIPKPIKIKNLIDTVNASIDHRGKKG